VVRPPAASTYPFDHTSIIATLRETFGLGGPLTGRDAAAPSLLSALSLKDPTNDGPDKIVPPGALPTNAEVAAIVQLPPNDLQAGLCSLAAHLPHATTDVVGHIAALEQGIIAPIAPVFQDVGAAADYVEARMRSFIGRI
jgi:phospholipase C